MAAGARLTRAQQRARTRSALLESATRVFAERGLERASIDEVAEAAGYTKGAFYANFASKADLFLAMLEERFAERIEELDAVTRTDESPELQAREAGLDFARFAAGDPDWQRLFLEFAAYATRDPEFREQLVARYRQLRERIAALYERRAQELEIATPVPAEQVALITFAMANGFALEKLLEPEAVPDDLFATMLFVFFTGLRTLAEQEAD
ncbi:MAG: TetR family transcriptional regulator [Thermoleophilaceae bacterium]|nr:TetR family transcriptional regulator [Thermoleophilaceae bacterium]